MIRHLIRWQFVFLLLSYPFFAMADNPLTDDEKKTIVYGMYRDYKKDFPEVKDMAPQEAMALLQTGKILFVDTRKDAEMKISMLPKAISEETYLKNQGQYKDKKIVLYCTISYRSGKLVQRLNKQEVEAYNLTGGLLAWVLEGGKVYDKKGETRRIHVYGKEWDYPPSGYETVMFTFFERLF
ncbi:MAG: rhodanese-like domain-containing protein [Desulfobacterales bacterium]